VTCQPTQPGAGGGVFLRWPLGASAGYEGVVQLWDRERDEAFTMSGGAPISTLAFSPVGDWLAAAGSDRVIRFGIFGLAAVRDLRVTPMP